MKITHGLIVVFVSGVAGGFILGTLKEKSASTAALAEAAKWADYEKFKAVCEESEYRQGKPIPYAITIRVPDPGEKRKDGRYGDSGYWYHLPAGVEVYLSDLDHDRVSRFENGIHVPAGLAEKWCGMIPVARDMPNRGGQVRYNPPPCSKKPM